MWYMDLHVKRIGLVCLLRASKILLTNSGGMRVSVVGHPPRNTAEDNARTTVVLYWHRGILIVFSTSVKLLRLLFESNLSR